MILKKRESSGIKYVEESLAFISKLYRNKKIILKKADSTNLNISAKLIKKGREFVISSSRTTSSKTFYQRKRIKKITAVWARSELILENVFINSCSPNGFEVEVGVVKSRQFSDKKKQYQRLIIPTKSSIKFFSILEQRTFKTSKVHSTECIRANLEFFNLDIYLYKDETKNIFLIIDCSTKVSHDKFSDAAFASLVVLGYLTGKFLQDEGVYLSYSTKQMNVPTTFKFITLRPSINSLFHPVNSNPYGFGIKGRKGDELYKKTKAISEIEFSKLCQLVLKKPNLRAALLLMMEALKGSVFTIAAGMAVILETLTNLYAEDNPDYFVHIKQPKIHFKILNELRSVISSHQSEIGVAEPSLQERINQINQVSNKVKLTKPFQLLGFELNENDKKVIERRNDLLHGRLTLNHNTNVDEADREMYLIATKLYTLINILVLKQVDFSGYIVNWPIFNKHVHKNNLNEEVFRKI